MATYSVRNPSDETETSAWTCQASSTVDAAHQYLAAFWSAEQHDDGSWYSPTYDGDIDGDDLEISILDSTRPTREIKMTNKTATTAAAIRRSTSRDEIVHLEHDEADHSVLAHRCCGSTETQYGVDYWGTDAGDWRVIVALPE